MPRFRYDGSRLRAARVAGNLSPEEVAVRIGRSVAIVTRAERGDHVPRIDKLAELAAAVGVRLDDLVVLDQDAE